jgi:hypothetical protein
MSQPSPDLAAVAGAFRASVGIFGAMGATLYAELSGRCAEDLDMLALAALAPDGARPTALFSAVHYRLLGDAPGAAADPLARWFATLTDDPLPPDSTAYEELRRFVAAHREELAEVLRTRTVQTTYAERCRALLPPMCAVAREAGEPLNLIEIGCSAGVLLALDKYAYQLNDQGLIGDPDSPVRLDGTLRGGGPELFIPRIGQRIGIDLHTMDVRAPEERRWLLSLCFPELRDEQRRLAAALDLVAATDIELREGDGLALLPEAFAATPDPLCIYHSACLFYWPSAARAALEELLLDLSQTRAFWRIAIEPSSAYDEWQKGQAAAPAPAGAAKTSGAIAIAHYRDGRRDRRPVARINPDYGVIDWIE